MLLQCSLSELYLVGVFFFFYAAPNSMMLDIKAIGLDCVAHEIKDGKYGVFHLLVPSSEPIKESLG